MNKLVLYATLLVLAHAAIIFWHLQVLALLNSALTPERAVLLASLVNVIPLIGVILLWTGFRKPAGWLLLIFFAIPLVIGGYEHFVKSGPDNVFQMARGEFTLPFQVSAVVLVIFEILVCWASIRILRAPSPLVEKRQVNLG
jgi:uncharacterized membrane protein